MSIIEESQSTTAAPRDGSASASIQIITVCMVAGAVMAFFSRILVVYYFGAGTVLDSYFAAYTTISIFIEVLQTGLFGVLLLPVFVKYRSDGNLALAWRLASNLFNLAALGSLILLGAAFLSGETLVAWIAEGFNQSGRDLTKFLFWLMLPIITLAVLNGMATSILHAFRRFALPAAMTLVVPTFMIGALLLFVKQLGIYTLPLGMVLGAAVQFAILYIGLRRLGMRHHWRVEPRQPEVRKIGLQVAPFIAAAVVVQARVGYITNLVSHLQEGSLTALSISSMMVFRLQDLATYGLLVVAYPLIAEKAVSGSFLEVADTIRRYFRMFAFLLLPSAVLIIVCRTPVVRFIYERGAFDAVDTQLTAGALGFFALYPFFQAGMLLLRRVLYSLRWTGIIVIFILLFQGLYVVIASVLIKSMAHEGIAFTLTVTTAIFFFVHVLYLHKRVVPLARQIFDPSIGQMGLAALACGCLAWASLWALGGWAEGGGFVARFMAVALPSAVGIVGYGLLAHRMRLHEMAEVLALAKRWWPWQARVRPAPAPSSSDVVR